MELGATGIVTDRILLKLTLVLVSIMFLSIVLFWGYIGLVQ